LVKSNRAFKSAKRSKELARLQKREEKRLRRQGRQEPPAETAEDKPRAAETVGPDTEPQSEAGPGPTDDQ